MGKNILITGFVPGYPNQKLSLEIAKTLIDAGADILELSASFSEPIADGPTLQLAHKRVLDSGFTKQQAFKLYRRIKGTEPAFAKPACRAGRATAGLVPFHPRLFLIEYANIIYQIGFDQYYRACAQAGINYLAVPDVPLEESEPFVAAAKKHGIAHIFLIAPTTPNERIKKIVEVAKKALINSSRLRLRASDGQAKSSLKSSFPAPNTALPPTFLYLVSITGVTGSRRKLNPDTLSFIKRVRRLTDLPLIVGFGISKPEHIKKVITAGGNGIVTCSAIVDMLHNLQKKPAQMLKAIRSYVKGLS